YGQGGTTEAPLLIEAPIYHMLRGERLDSLAPINFRLVGDYSAYGQLGWGYKFESVGRGLGEWDNNYWIPQAERNLNGAKIAVLQAELTAPHCGYEPCPWTEPNLSATLFALVCPSAGGGGSYGAPYTCGSLGALGTYPPIACRTVFKSVDWNTGAIAAG